MEEAASQATSSSVANTYYFHDEGGGGGGGGGSSSITTTSKASQPTTTTTPQERHHHHHDHDHVSAAAGTTTPSLKRPVHGWRVDNGNQAHATTRQEWQKQRRRHLVILGIFLLVAASVVVVVVVLLVVTNGNDDDKRNTRDPTSISFPSSVFANPTTVTWELVQDIRDDGNDANGEFARDVRLSTNGQVLYIGTLLRGYGLLYHYNETSTEPFVLHTRLTVENFLTSDTGVTHAALAGNGHRLAIRTQDETVATYDYDTATDTWIPHDQLLQGNAAQYERFGESFALDYHGNLLAIGAPRSNAAAPQAGQIRLWRRTVAQTWNLAAQVYGWKINDGVGTVTSLNADGTRLVSGFPLNNAGTGIVWIWENVAMSHNSDNDNDNPEEEWQLLGEPLRGTDISKYFGVRVELSANGNVVAVLDSTGWLYVYEWNASAGAWQAKGQALQTRDDHFGACISADGNFVVQGLHPYQYHAANKQWIPMAPLPFVDPHENDNNDTKPTQRNGGVQCAADARIIVKTQEEKRVNSLNRAQIGTVQVFRAVER